MGRVPVKVLPFAELSSLKCNICGSILACIDQKAHTSVWYCVKCDIYTEVTTHGTVLHTFKKEPQVIFLQGGQDGQGRS